MQHNKNTKSLSEIKSYCQNSSVIVGIFNQLIGRFDLRYINKLFSGTKKRGVDGSNIFQTLFVFRFLDFSNVSQLMQSGFSKELTHQKDVLYDFLNNEKIRWRAITLLFFKQVIGLINENGVFESSELLYESLALANNGHTGSFTIPIGTPIGDYRMRIRGQWNNNTVDPCNIIAYGEAEDYKLTVTNTASMVYTSSTTTQNNTSDVLSCSSNQEIIGIQIVTNGTASPLTVDKFRIKTNGSTNNGILNNVSNIHIYYTGTSSTFTTNSLFGSDLPQLSGDPVDITGSQTLVEGTNYFWVAYDINPSATFGDLLDARCNKIFFSGGSDETPSTTHPLGNRTIVKCSSPGGIIPADVKTWFKIDNYTSGSTSWNSSRVNLNLPTLVSSVAPSYEAANSRWNYNPSLKFGGNQNDNFRADITSSSDVLGSNQGTIIAVGTYEGNGSAPGGRTDIDMVGYFGSPGSGNDEFSFQSNGTWYRGNNITGTWLTTTEPMNFTPSIHTTQFSSAANPSMKQFKNAGNNGTANNTATFRNTGSQKFSIGEVPGAPHDFVGTVTEVITFRTSITAAERNRAESYLVLKYGITLGTPSAPINYNSSVGTTYWSGNSGYQRNVIGIGQDLNSDLLQKQSHQIDDSVRIYIGNLVQTNINNSGSFKKDRSFVMMGSSSGRLCATNISNTELPPGIALFSKLEREWRITRTNMDEVFCIDIKLALCGLPGSVDVNDLRFLIDTDDNFANGGTQAFYHGDAHGTGISYNNGTITIKGINTTHIPDNSTRFFTIGSIKSATPLPVEFIDFIANCESRKVKLEWSTATETNNDFFTIEKSIDGYLFEVITEIDGKGNKNSLSNYTFTDYESKVGMSYYRISQTDFDGKVTMLKTISSNCSSNEEISFHPNPTKEGVYVTFNAEKNKTIEIRVSDLLGKTISTHEINSSSWIPLPSVSGIYLLKYNINSSTKVEKIIKQ